MRGITAIAILALLTVTTVGCGGSGSTPPSGGQFSITSLSPKSAPAGSADLKVLVTGSDFANEKHNLSQAVWSVNGTDIFLATTFDNSSQLTATISASLMVAAVTAQVRVETGDPMGDGPPLTSNSLTFTVTPPSAQSGFTPAGSMLAARSGHSATLLADGRVLLVGGDGSAGTAEIYDPDGGTFTSTGSLNHSRDGQQAVLLPDSRVLIAGGEDSVNVVASAEVYDPATSAFTPIVDMTYPRWGHTATLLNSGKVLITGGYGTSDAQASAELFDPATNSFTFAGNMTFPRMHHTATLLPDGRVLIAGGWISDAPITVVPTAEIFDPNTGVFTAISSMNHRRAMHTATPLAGGVVAILGGETAVASIDDDEVFMSGPGDFTLAANLVQPRDLHTATLLSSGKVLVAGGVHYFFDDDGLPEWIALQSAEVFDPVANTCTPTLDMHSARVGHSATLLKNGQVLVAGGSDAKGNALSSAELFK
jgi:hypothetical protein